jgi:small-conductance mechanosensitive channel
MLINQDMNLFEKDFHEWIFPLSLIFGGVVVGFIFEKIFLGWFKRFSKRTKWEYDDIIAHGLSFYTTFWFSLIGLYAASFNVYLNADLLHHLHQIIIVTAILSVTFFFARISVGIVNQFSRKKTGDQPSTSIFVNITRVVVYVIGILIVLQSLGISITPIITALGVGGLAVALALQDTLSNFFAGIQILITKQIRTGDFIRLDSGEEGFVNDVNWRNTAIKTTSNNIIVIPNSKLSSSKITNYHLPDLEMAFTVSVGVSYDEDLEKVEAVAIDVAKKVLAENPAAGKNFEPVVRFHTFGDFDIKFNVVLKTGNVNDQYALKHDFIKKLHARFKKEGIEIPYPIQTILSKKEK